MSNLTPNEQFMLELINRARLDPAAEAARQHISLNEGLKSGTISTSAKQALAGNDFLNAAADGHSQAMLDHDYFAHVDPNTSSTPGSRAVDAGYGSIYVGENIAWRGSTGSINAASMIQTEFNDLFVDSGVSGRGHRTNLLSADWREAGVSQKIGDFKYEGTTYQSSMITQDFGKAGSNVFITGVVYNDNVKNDNFFTIGEQQAGVGASATNGSTVNATTGAGGGYELAVAPSSGHWTVTFDGSVSVDINLGSGNAKVDFVNGREIWTTNSTASLSPTVTSIIALGQSGVTLTGSDVSEHLTGNKGNNRLLGNDGADTLTGNGGHDTLTGGLGDDRFVYKATGDSGIDAAHRDTVTDFDAAGNDVIDLSGLSGTYAYRGTGAFTGAHQVRVTSTTGGVLVHVSTDTDHTDEMTIFLSGAHLGDMSKGDFIL